MTDFNLPDDGIRAVRKRLRIIVYLFEIFAFKAFGRKLNRGQRILDFMGDSAGNI